MARRGPGRIFRYPLEAAALFAVMALFRVLPVEAASNLGGCIGRTLGPLLPVTGRAQRNLRHALPDLSAAETAAIVTNMWDNLGRTAAEYPHLGRIADPASGRVTLVDLSKDGALEKRLRPGILVAGHLGNWEILSAMAGRIGMDMAVVTRPPNNPLVRGLIDRLRGIAGGRRIAKGRGGARDAIALLRRGGALGIMADQRASDGIAGCFFGQEAMTAAGPAQLALRFRCPLVPVRVERLGPARFRLTFHPPLALPDSGDRQGDVAALTGAINRQLEAWIRERPGDWLWLHRRWGTLGDEAAGEGVEREGIA